MMKRLVLADGLQAVAARRASPVAIHLEMPPQDLSRIQERKCLQSSKS
jgi:hypothetical protein